MDKNVTDVLSLAILIIMLATGLSLGATSVIRANKMLSDFDVTYEDKTASIKYTPSLKVYGEYNGTLTKSEAMIATVIQDANMPYSQKMQIGANTVSISSAYEEKALTTYAGYTRTFVAPDAADASYRFVYDYTTGNYVLRKQ